MTDPYDSLDGPKREIRDLNAASSRTTQHQVSQLRSSAAAEKSSLQPEIVVVSIPDVSIHYPADSRQKSERAPVIATVPFERAAAKADLSTSGTDSPNPALNTTPSVGDSNLALPKVFLSPDTLPTGPLGQQSAATRETPVPKTSAEAQESDAWWYSLADLANDRAIVELTRRIASQFPSIAPSTLMFTSADPELSTNRAAARIAASLVKLTGCRVLLVDANWEMNMSPLKQSGDAVLGLTEVLADNRSWKDFVIETNDRLLHVLPCGVTDVPMRQLTPESLLALNAQWQAEFTYVFINAGSAKQLVTRRFARCCDGTYILVGLNHTTKKDARATIKLLAENHARVLGAIVFDSPLSVES